MKKNFLMFIYILLASGAFFGCTKEPVSPSEVPPDFAFSLIWNCYGDSSYDSKTGKLIKTKNATDPDDYITELFLNDEQIQAIWSILSKTDLSKYPTYYDPNEGSGSEPPMTLILKVEHDDESYSISCINISISFESPNKKGQEFLTVCESIINILTNTDEWRALPEYEFFYE